MIIKLTDFIEFFGFAPEKNQFVIIDGFYWIIDGFYGDDIYLAETHPIAQ